MSTNGFHPRHGLGEEQNGVPHSGLTILLIRPGLTELDEQGRIVGTLDVPLSEKGMDESRQMADQIRELDLNIIYVAPTLAAKETSRLVTEDRNVKIRTEDDLRNLDHGLWQGKPIEELRTNHPKLVRKWEEFPESVCPPFGEPIEDVIPRVEKLLMRIVRKFKSGNVAIVAPEPLASIISSTLRETKISHLLKAQAQSAGIEVVEVSSDYAASLVAK
jgi:broad specificity phosphatase PhoE